MDTKDPTYEIPKELTYHAEIRKLQNDDLLHADNVVNPVIQKLIENIAYTQKQLEEYKLFTGHIDEDVLGVEVDFESNKITRLAGAEGKTAGADFDIFTPWGGRKRCIVTGDGKVLAYYGEEGYTETGALSTAITKDKIEYPIGTTVQVMVEQPIFYTKVVPIVMKDAFSGRGKQLTKARYYISSTPKVGFKANEAFKDDEGILQDKIYLSAYEGCVYDVSEKAYIKDDTQVADFTANTEDSTTNTGTTGNEDSPPHVGDMFSSIAEVKPASGATQNLTRANARILATNRGEGWKLHSIFALAITQILALVEYATFDLQSVIGRGVCDLKSEEKCVITGGTARLGNSSGMGDGENGKVSVSYRGEENLWGNIWTWLDGITVEANGIHNAYLKAQGDLIDNTKSGYDELGFKLLQDYGKYQSAFGYSEKYDYLFFPTECTEDINLSIGDSWFYPNSNGFKVALLGGRWTGGSTCGLWYLSLGESHLSRSFHFGGRLLYIPQSSKSLNK